MRKTFIIAAALTALLTAPAPAQQSAPPKQGFVQNRNAGEWRGSKLIGASVYGPDNSSIGEISDVLIGGDGRIRAVVVGVGGFLGLADKDIAVPFQALRIRSGAVPGAIDKITVSYSKDDLKSAPRFAYDEAAKPATSGLGGAPAAPPTKPPQ